MHEGICPETFFEEDRPIKFTNVYKVVLFARQSASDTASSIFMEHFLE